MNYKDYITLTPEDYQILKDNYDKVRIQEVNDLNEIITKLKEQKSILEKSENHKYLHIIPKLQDGIETLEKVATSNRQRLNTNYPTTPNTSTSRFPQSTNKSDSEVITPIKASNNKKRNHYSPNNIFTNILRKFKFQSKTIPNNKFHTIVIADNEVTTTCNSHPQNCTRQLDIIRLLLLYMTLKPTCPYIHTISSVATNQLDAYISMLSIE